MIHLIHMQQDLFVWQQLNVAAGLDFFVFFFLGGGVGNKKYVWSVWWSCLGLKGPDWLQLIYVCVGVRLVETGACNLCFFSIRNETKTN